MSEPIVRDGSYHLPVLATRQLHDSCFLTPGRPSVVVSAVLVGRVLIDKDELVAQRSEPDHQDGKLSSMLLVSASQDGRV